MGRNLGVGGGGGLGHTQPGAFRPVTPVLQGKLHTFSKSLWFGQEGGKRFNVLLLFSEKSAELKGPSNHLKSIRAAGAHVRGYLQRV